MTYDPSTAKAQRLAHEERAERERLCVHCKRPRLPGKVRCARCHEWNYTYSMARARRLGAKPTTARCSVCGERGHFRPRCPSREVRS